MGAAGGLRLPSPTQTCRSFIEDLRACGVPHPPFASLPQLLSHRRLAALCIDRLTQSTLLPLLQRQLPRGPTQRGTASEESTAAEEEKSLDHLLTLRLRSSFQRLQSLLGVDLSHLSPSSIVRGEEDSVLFALQLLHAVLRQFGGARGDGRGGGRGRRGKTSSPPPSPSPRSSPSSSFPLFRRRSLLPSSSPASLLRAVDSVESFLQRAATAASHHSPPSAGEAPPSPSPSSSTPPLSPSPDVAPVAVSALDEVLRHLKGRPELLGSEGEEPSTDSDVAEPHWTANGGAKSRGGKGLRGVGRLPRAGPTRQSRGPPQLSPLTGLGGAVSSVPPSSSAVFSPPLPGRTSLSASAQLSARHRRAAAARLRGLSRTLREEEEEWKREDSKREADVVGEERRRERERKRLEEEAVERCLRRAMGRGRREERELERLVDEQAKRVSLLLQQRREGLVGYYREQLHLVQEKIQRDEEEARAQRQEAIQRSRAAAQDLRHNKRRHIQVSHS